MVGTCVIPLDVGHQSFAIAYINHFYEISLLQSELYHPRVMLFLFRTTAVIVSFYDVARN